MIREAVEAFIRLVKSEVHESAVLIAADDAFEVTKTPSVILQGPTLTEDAARRTPAKVVEINQDDMSFEECRHPRLYHLDFDVIVTTAKESDLLDLTERVARFYQLHPTVSIGELGGLSLTELVPLGGLRRVNLSNLRQASGRCRVEDCPVYDGRVSTGKLASALKVELTI